MAQFRDAIALGSEGQAASGARLIQKRSRGSLLLESIAYNFGPVAVILVIWQVVAKSGAIHPALFPPLEAIWQAVVNQAARGLLWTDITHSVTRILVGVGLGIVWGTVVGLLMGVFKPLERFLVPPVQFFLSVPGLALLPLFILWFGLNQTSLLALLSWEAGITAVLNVYSGVKSVSQTLINAARTMGVSHRALFYRILIPGALPFMITGYRLSFSRGWRILVAAEMLAAVGTGLGYRIFSAQEFMQTAVIYGGVMIVGILGLIIERILLRSVEQWTVERWGLLRS